MKEVEKKHPELDLIFVIRDNARYYTSKYIKEGLEESKIVMVPLPSYSPNLNLIERLWKLFKKKVLYNKYYEKIHDFRDAVFVRPLNLIKIIYLIIDLVYNKRNIIKIIKISFLDLVVVKKLNGRKFPYIW